MNDTELQDFIEWQARQQAMSELSNVVDFVSGQAFTWLELWVLYGVDRVQFNNGQPQAHPVQP